MKITVKLLVPPSGFCRCEVECYPPVVGGEDRYRVKSVTKLERDKRTPLDLEVMERMNDIHQEIVDQTQGEFARKELGMDIGKPEPKKKMKIKIHRDDDGQKKFELP